MLKLAAGVFIAEYAFLFIFFFSFEDTAMMMGVALAT